MLWHIDLARFLCNTLGWSAIGIIMLYLCVVELTITRYTVMALSKATADGVDCFSHGHIVLLVL